THDLHSFPTRRSSDLPAVLAVTTISLLNAKPNGPPPAEAELPAPEAEKVPAGAACPPEPTVKETIWLTAGSVTNKDPPSGVKEISAAAAALLLGRNCVEPGIGARSFAWCASGVIRKPVMLGDAPPEFSTE